MLIHYHHTRIPHSFITNEWWDNRHNSHETERCGWCSWCVSHFGIDKYLEKKVRVNLSPFSVLIITNREQIFETSRTAAGWWIRVGCFYDAWRALFFARRRPEGGNPGASCGMGYVTHRLFSAPGNISANTSSRNQGIGVDSHAHRLTNQLGWHRKPTNNAEETRCVCSGQVELTVMVPFRASQGD